MTIEVKTMTVDRKPYTSMAAIRKKITKEYKIPRPYAIAIAKAAHESGTHRYTIELVGCKNNQCKKYIYNIKLSPNSKPQVTTGDCVLEPPPKKKSTTVEKKNMFDYLFGWIWEGTANKKQIREPEYYQVLFCKATINKKTLGAKGKEGYALVLNDKLIAKVFKPRKSVKKMLIEANFAKRAGEAGIGPKVHYVDKNKKFIVFDRLKETLPDALQKNNWKSIPDTLQKQIIKQLYKLDELDILQNDPNPLNFMLDHNDKIKIIDYGFAKALSKQKVITSNIESLDDLFDLSEKKPTLLIKEYNKYISVL
jgi:predicted Ser/Thr protein kinase